MPVGRRLPFAIVIVLFGISLAFGLRALLEQERAQHLRLTDKLWIIDQLEIEYLRFLGAFDRFALTPQDQVAEEDILRRRGLKRRLDVLWSRIPLLNTGEEGRLFESVPDVHDLARDLEAMLRDSETAILSLAPGDAAAYRALRDRLAEPGQRIHTAVRSAFVADEDEINFFKAEQREANLMLAASLLGILISGAALIFFLICEIRAVGRAQASMRNALDQAEAASRAKSEFLATMSHELRTPLNAIIGFAEILKLETFGPIGIPRYREYVEDIHTSGNHLLTIIGDILDLAKIEAGKIELQEEDVDLAEAIDLATRIVQPNGVEAGLSFEKGVVANLPCLRGDPRLIRQMTLNLMSNAVKFTPAGGIVTVEAARAGNGGVLVRVTDTGIGMPKDQIETALSPFGQIATNSQHSRAGTGLGLALVKAFAELHGAKFLLDAEPGAGTVAEILFPASRVVECAAA